jgi:hypothetical protein
VRSKALRNSATELHWSRSAATIRWTRDARPDGEVGHFKNRFRRVLNGSLRGQQGFIVSVFGRLRSESRSAERILTKVACMYLMGFLVARRDKPHYDTVGWLTIYRPEPASEPELIPDRWVNFAAFR